MSSTVRAHVDAATSCTQASCRALRHELAEALLVLGDLVASDLMDSGPCVHNDRGDCLEHLWSPADTDLDVDSPHRTCPHIRARQLLARHPLDGAPTASGVASDATDRQVPQPRTAPGRRR